MYGISSFAMNNSLVGAVKTHHAVLTAARQSYQDMLCDIGRFIQQEQEYCVRYFFSSIPDGEREPESGHRWAAAHRHFRRDQHRSVPVIAITLKVILPSRMPFLTTTTNQGNCTASGAMV